MHRSFKLNCKRSLLINGFLRNIRDFIYLLKIYKNHLFSNLGQLETRTVVCLKNEKVDKHALVFNITKDKSDQTNQKAEI